VGIFGKEILKMLGGDGLEILMLAGKFGKDLVVRICGQRGWEFPLKWDLNRSVAS
jgi:hypothetical protein